MKTGKRLRTTLLVAITILLSLPCVAQDDGGGKKKKTVKTEQRTSNNTKQKQQEIRRQQEAEAKRKQKEEVRRQREDSLTPSEMVAKGLDAEHKSDYTEAVRWYRKAADQGDADAIKK